MPTTGEHLDRLEVPPMVAPGAAGCDTAFSVSIDHVDSGSGIGAADRAHTVRRFLDPDSGPGEFVRPGHVFPLRARDGGVLERRGHTEAAVDLARLAGLPPVAVICEVLHDDGSPARLPFLELFAQEHRVAIISVDQVAEHRLSIGDVGAGATVAAGRAPLLL
jgi:3,4-dihydroxy 2-butanone 4-phosphate synthase/GTP cyclohydrolase II